MCLISPISCWRVYPQYMIVCRNFLGLWLLRVKVTWLSRHLTPEQSSWTLAKKFHSHACQCIILYLSFSTCHSLSVILYLSFSICHSLSVILITVKPFYSVFWRSLYYSCVKLWHLYILKIWPLRHFVRVITSRDSVPRIMFEGHRRRLVFQHLLFEGDTRDWLFSRRYIS